MTGSSDEWTFRKWSNVDELRKWADHLDLDMSMLIYGRAAALIRELCDEVEHHRTTYRYVPWNDEFHTAPLKEPEGPFSTLLLELRTPETVHSTRHTLSELDDEPWKYKYTLERMAKEFVDHLRKHGHFGGS